MSEHNDLKLDVKQWYPFGDWEAVISILNVPIILMSHESWLTYILTKQPKDKHIFGNVNWYVGTDDCARIKVKVSPHNRQAMGAVVMY